MKRLLRTIIGIGLLAFAQAYAGVENVEFCAECSDSCCEAGSFKGFYFGANAGYSWYTFELHRPNFPDLFPLNKTEWLEQEWVPIGFLGYDFYPRHKIPTRLELNVTYGDIHFTSNPLFAPPFGDGAEAKDGFRYVNSMLSVYFDMHTCTRFVPFIAVSAGHVNMKTDHVIHIPQTLVGPTLSRTENAVSYGGSLGTRFFFTNHFVGNLQVRFNDLKELKFARSNEFGLTGTKDYVSDYFHETSVLFGLAYEF